MFSLKTLRLYPFLKLAIALILGMWLAASMHFLLSWQWAIGFIAVVIIALLIRRPFLQSLLLLFSVFLLGGTLMTRQMENIGDGYAADEKVFDAVVASQPVMKKKVMQMDLWITSASQPMKVKASIFRDDRAENLKPGDGIRAKAPLEKPANYVNSTFMWRNAMPIMWRPRHTTSFSPFCINRNMPNPAMPSLSRHLSSSTHKLAKNV